MRNFNFRQHFKDIFLVIFNFKEELHLFFIRTGVSFKISLLLQSILMIICQVQTFFIFWIFGKFFKKDYPFEDLFGFKQKYLFASV